MQADNVRDNCKLTYMEMVNINYSLLEEQEKEKVDSIVSRITSILCQAIGSPSTGEQSSFDKQVLSLQSLDNEEKQLNKLALLLDNEFAMGRANLSETDHLSLKVLFRKLDAIQTYHNRKIDITTRDEQELDDILDIIETVLKQDNQSNQKQIDLHQSLQLFFARFDQN